MPLAPRRLSCEDIPACLDLAVNRGWLPEADALENPALLRRRLGSRRSGWRTLGDGCSDALFAGPGLRRNDAGARESEPPRTWAAIDGVRARARRSGHGAALRDRDGTAFVRTARLRGGGCSGAPSRELDRRNHRTAPPSRVMTAQDMSSVIALDRAGVRRGPQRLAEGLFDCATRAWCSNETERSSAFGIAWPNFERIQLGPIVAPDQECGADVDRRLGARTRTSQCASIWQSRQVELRNRSNQRGLAGNPPTPLMVLGGETCQATARS